MKTYPLADRHEGQNSTNGKTKDGLTLRAVVTGEFRAPRKGEWYISGAIPEAYQAKNDLTMTYLIAKIVKVKSVTTEVIVGDA